MVLQQKIGKGSRALVCVSICFGCTVLLINAINVEAKEVLIGSFGVLISYSMMGFCVRKDWDSGLAGCSLIAPFCMIAMLWFPKHGLICGVGAVVASVLWVFATYIWEKYGSGAAS